MFLAGCDSAPANGIESSAAQAAPTAHSLFEKNSGSVLEEEEMQQAEIVQAEAMPTTADTFSQPVTPIAFEDTPTARPEPISPTSTPTATIAASSYIVEYIYDDGVHTAWDVVPGKGMDVGEEMGQGGHSGSSYLAVTPLVDYATVHFVVKPDEGRTYRREDVLGLSLWLRSSEGIIQPDGLAVAVVGSNEFPNWVEFDDSVEFAKGESFSETRLYFMGIGRAITSETWVEATVMLDDLIYDPEYAYVTAIYLKNDEGLRQTVLVDDISLLIAEDGVTKSVPLDSEPATLATPAVAATEPLIEPAAPSEPANSASSAAVETSAAVRKPSFRVQVNSASLRLGPGTSFERTGFAYAGDELEIIGRSDTSYIWLNVRRGDGQTGWVALDVGELIWPLEVAAIPLVEAMPPLSTSAVESTFTMTSISAPAPEAATTPLLQLPVPTQEPSLDA